MVVHRATPPLKKQFDQIAALTYSYYDKHGKIPENPDYLPPSLNSLLGPKSGILWNGADKGYSYTYSKLFPINISMLEIASFGLVKIGHNSSGKLITPDMIRDNTPIFKNAGKLRSLPE